MSWKCWFQPGTATIGGQEVRGIARYRNDEARVIRFERVHRISVSPGTVPPSPHDEDIPLADFTPDPDSAALCPVEGTQGGRGVS